jgi:TPP-dependent pyruvate/acetoin dehydrogenase alpha subunit
MDVLAVEAATTRSVAAIRAGGGPALLEARTYRFRAHSMYDPELYRDKAEVEHWKKRCPVEGFAAQLRASRLLTDRDWVDLEAGVAAQVTEAVAAAEAGPWEPVEDLLKDVHTPVDGPMTRDGGVAAPNNELAKGRNAQAELVKR